ncbi:thiamine-phosphate kinase [Akkermansia glycaniphila]|uniref:thiamine-phosphate kinase n=1 Tax=Akkermansia glycaniphila TaxID=1679444 RepID=UPI001C034291|nr:thiamine-phosphate kinase [Akkermansia glycaniphila]MBT9449574.1 thiamine-phosphate kinase [Akkermansia glycaniphila]
MKLDELGENAFLRQLLPGLPGNEELLVGPGDDCAVVTRDEHWDTLLKTDALVEGVHFLRDTDPYLVGRKALGRAFSDIAAMGGDPEHALVTILVHPSRQVESLLRLYEGLSSMAAAYEVSLAGGETSSLPFDGLALSVTVTGRVLHGRVVLRSTGKPGDLLCVTGRLGGSFVSGRHLDFTPRLREARILCSNGLLPTAMMDLSDGIGTDLPRLAEASGCSYELNLESLPLHPGCTIEQALGDGEDYELLFTIDPEFEDHLFRVQGLFFPETPVTVIGCLVPRGSAAPSIPTGWQHFQA